MSLTQKQKITLEFIEGFIQENGYSPSYREIGDACGQGSTSSTSRSVHCLIQRGYLVKVGGARSLAVTRGSKPKDVKRREHITNCHSTLLLEELFSQAPVREAMSSDMITRVTIHMRSVKLMGVV